MLAVENEAAILNVVAPKMMHGSQGDQIEFSPIRLLFVSLRFFKRRNSPKMATNWATNLLNFHLNKLFKNMVCIVALFGLATVLATFPKKIWPIFPQSSDHPMAAYSQCTGCRNFAMTKLHV